MERYICIHGHFYQPPRENPWLEAIEIQDSAFPYHDWNQRITAECYAPNGASRILDAEGRITRVVNNYSRISFNFGPTLLAWMEHKAPAAYEAILEADAESRKRFSGHGSALAQAYNHTILPLSNTRDKRTQIRWGICDFQRRFGRSPEGMWLPEAAVNLETLDLLSAAGIKFTILSPRQASRVRPLGSRAWQDVKSGRIDPSMAYSVRLPSGRPFALFFYDGYISRAVAFEDLLSRGEDLANRLAGAFSADRTWPQLVHIATDGETYGHHRRHAEMALAYTLEYIESHNLARLTNYGEYLEQHPPSHEVQIFENSSWSCMHGVERWRSNCGCNTGMRPGWNQEWRGPLREALEWLRSETADRFQRASQGLFHDPWKARDHYIDVLLDRSTANVDRFLRVHCGRELSPKERTRALKLLEMQRQSMLMFTSCGWFFDDLSRIETVQVIAYAGRVMQLAVELFGDAIEEPFLKLLERAKSNLAEHGDGRAVYEKFVRPAIVTLESVGAHYAISSLFEEYGATSDIYCHKVERQDFHLLQAGRTSLALGRAKVTSQIDADSRVLSFGALHLGDHNITGGVRVFRGDELYGRMIQEITTAFDRRDIPELIRAVDRNFGSGVYSLRLLFRDEQRKIVGVILENAVAEAAALYRSFYSQHAALAHFAGDLGVPLPARFRMAVESTLTEDLLAELSADEPDPRRVGEILEEVRHTGSSLDAVRLEFALRLTIERAGLRLLENPEDLARLRSFKNTVGLCARLPFEVNLWTAQNQYFRIRETHFEPFQNKAAAGDAGAKEWIAVARALGESLFVSQSCLVAETAGL